MSLGLVRFCRFISEKFINYLRIAVFRSRLPYNAYVRYAVLGLPRRLVVESFVLHFSCIWVPRLTDALRIRGRVKDALRFEGASKTPCVFEGAPHPARHGRTSFRFVQ